GNAQVARGTILGSVAPFLASLDRFDRKRNRPQSLYLCGWENNWHSLAERVGSDPTVGVSPQRFSRPPHSTALPPLRQRETSGTIGTGISASSEPYRGLDILQVKHAR